MQSRLLVPAGGVDLRKLLVEERVVLAGEVEADHLLQPRDGIRRLSWGSILKQRSARSLSITSSMKWWKYGFSRS